MTNLFSIFDPFVMGLGLNWVSALLVSGFLLPGFWVGSSQISVLMNSGLSAFEKSLNLVFMPRVTPGVSFIGVGLFIFLLFNNSLGLLPFVFTASSHLMFTLGLALSIWLGTLLWGAVMNTSVFLAHFVPLGSPLVLGPFMVMIEIISNLIRPITLSVRLMANMTSGHLLLHLLGGAGYNLGFGGSFIYLSSIALMLLEMGVAIIQAYVFVLLLSLYISEVNFWKSS
uniref:ATP synthase subunit a n=1 Tax=Lernaea cyprinacea TaxID=342429 RepID=A0A0U1XCS7_9MAXI|nr:ATP synthase F0 subunit 6 [Lernaea cyprinacea]AIQ80158.1 ATP synthase F0 subunit 6 [Lernaea cyprinacea]